MSQNNKKITSRGGKIEGPRVTTDPGGDCAARARSRFYDFIAIIIIID